MATLTDKSGTVVFTGTITGLPASGIPQGGPLTADLLTGGHLLKGADSAHGTGGNVVTTGGDGNGGGSGVLRGGDDGVGQPATVGCGGSHNGGVHGLVQLKTDGSTGLAGEALVADGAGTVRFGGVQVAGAPPAGAPTGLPFAVDTTAVTGGLYVWNGAAWVKISTIP